MTQKIFSELMHLFQRFLNLYSFLFYYLIDCLVQKRQLRRYETGVKDYYVCNPLEGKVFCVFVFYEPGGFVSGSCTRVVSELRAQGINVVLVCNHDLSDKQSDFFRVQCHSVILRSNQGFDFGGYKDAISQLRKERLAIDRLLIMNDSVFFASSGLSQFISRLLSDEDVIAAFENWGEDHHLQSFCLSVSKLVYESEQFEGFWDKYVPINNRRYAIEYGEKALSACILGLARSTKVIYPVSNLVDNELLNDLEFYRNAIWMPLSWRHITNSWNQHEDGERISRDELDYKELSVEFLTALNATSPIHAGAFLFPKVLNCPIFKKDLVYRGRFNFWEVEAWSAELLNEEEHQEFLHGLRFKGAPDKLRFTDRLKYNVGVK